MRFGIRILSNKSIEPRIAVSRGLEFHGKLLPVNREGGQVDFSQKIEVDGQI